MISRCFSFSSLSFSHFTRGKKSGSWSHIRRREIPAFCSLFSSCFASWMKERNLFRSSHPLFPDCCSFSCYPFTIITQEEPDFLSLFTLILSLFIPSFFRLLRRQKDPWTVLLLDVGIVWPVALSLNLSLLAEDPFLLGSFFFSSRDPHRLSTLLSFLFSQLPGRPVCLSFTYRHLLHVLSMWLLVCHMKDGRKNGQKEQKKSWQQKKLQLMQSIDVSLEYIFHMWAPLTFACPLVSFAVTELKRSLIHSFFLPPSHDTLWLVTREQQNRLFCTFWPKRRVRNRYCCVYLVFVCFTFMSMCVSEVRDERYSLYVSHNMYATYTQSACSFVRVFFMCFFFWRFCYLLFLRCYVYFSNYFLKRVIIGLFFIFRGRGK